MSRSVSRTVHQHMLSYYKLSSRISNEEIMKLTNELKLYEPDDTITYDEYKKIIDRYYTTIWYPIAFNKEIETQNKKDFIKKLQELRNLKLEKYKDKDKLPKGQKKITEFYKPIKASSISASPSQPELKKEDICAQKYLEKSIRENKERQRRQQEYDEWRKTIDERNKQIRKLFNMPSSLLQRLTSSLKKQENPEIKINKWNDKILEFITEFTLYNPSKCTNLDECNEKINIIIDIINSFIERPNTMVYDKLPIIKDKNDKYNIEKNKIYKSFLEDYKNILEDNDLEHPLYKKLYEDNKKILTVLQNMKLDDCKNTFLIENKGGRLLKKKYLKKRYLKNSY
jgi:hypothetical protein